MQLKVLDGHVGVGDIEMCEDNKTAAMSTTFWVTMKSMKIFMGTTNLWEKRTELNQHKWCVGVPCSRVKLCK